MRHSLLAALGLAAAFAAAAPARSEDGAALLAAWSAAYAAGPTAEVGRLYTLDARLWSELSPQQAIGHADIAHYFATLDLGPAPARLRIDAQEQRGIGSGILVSGRYTLLRERWDGSIAEEPCRFTLALLREDDGGWRIAEQHASRLPGTR